MTEVKKARVIIDMAGGIIQDISSDIDLEVIILDADIDDDASPRQVTIDDEVYEAAKWCCTAYENHGGNPETFSDLFVDINKQLNDNAWDSGENPGVLAAKLDGSGFVDIPKQWAGIEK